MPDFFAFGSMVEKVSSLKLEQSSPPESLMFFRFHKSRIWLGVTIAFLIAAHSLFAADSLHADVQVLVNLGARVAGSPTAERASQYLIPN
ncbi:MAG: hypothetical protein C4288_21935 [Leptolyngbya sp. ERB_1_1]